MKRAIHLLFLFSLFGCASQQDLNTLKWEVDALSTRLTKAEEQVREKDRVFSQTLSQQAELQARYTEIQDQLLTIQGRLEEIQASAGTQAAGAPDDRIDALEQAVAAIRQDLDRKPAPPVKSQYESGVDSFRAGRYADAIVDLETFLAHNPEASLIDNAHFWIGESYYAMGKYEDAILRYDLVVRKYKSSEKVTDCLLKQGMSFMRMGDKETGALILQQLIKGHPQSDAAAKAQKILKSGAGDG